MTWVYDSLEQQLVGLCFIPKYRRPKATVHKVDVSTLTTKWAICRLLFFRNR